MKKSICIFLLTFLVQISWVQAQSPKIDSLKNLLKTEKRDSIRCMLLVKLSDQYSETNPDTALLFAEAGRSIARQMGYTDKETVCLTRIGLAFASMGNDAKALEILLQSLKRAETAKEQSLYGYISRCIGNVYSDQDDERKSLEYIMHARNVAISMHDENLKMACTFDMGDIYEKLNLLDSAKLFTEEVYDFALKNKDTAIMGMALNNLGNVYSKMDEPQVAMDKYKMSLLYLKDFRTNDVFCETTLGMAKLFQQTGHDDSCLHYAELSYIVAKNGNLNSPLLNGSSFLANYYKQHHVVDSSYAYLLVAMSTKDTLYNQERRREIQNLSFDEKIRQQEIAAQEKIAEENHIRNLQLLAIGIFIPVFFMGVLLLSRTKVKPRVVEFLGIFSLLLFFEFITDLIYPYVSQLTNENPIWEMLFLVILAALLEPLNFKLEHWVKGHLTHKPTPTPVPVVAEDVSYEID